MLRTQLKTNPKEDVIKKKKAKKEGYQNEKEEERKYNAEDHLKISKRY